jgi:hypothetical protein
LWHCRFLAGAFVFLIKKDKQFETPFQAGDAPRAYLPRSASRRSAYNHIDV